MPDNSTRIDIFDQSYKIRGAVDPKYLAELAAYVDQKMREIAGASKTVDSLKVAVMAALNITDEYFRARDERAAETGSLAERAAALERIVDHALQLAE